MYFLKLVESVCIFIKLNYSFSITLEATNLIKGTSLSNISSFKLGLKFEFSDDSLE